MKRLNEKDKKKENLIEVGICEKGKYKKFKDESGNIKKIVYTKQEDLDEPFFIDKYNKIHNYRRAEDQIVFYYNLETMDKIILPIKIGDDLKKEPFNLLDSFIIEDHTIGYVSDKKGIVPATEKNLEVLKDMEIINEEEQYVLSFNKKNPGFYL